MPTLTFERPANSGSFDLIPEGTPALVSITNIELRSGTTRSGKNAGKDWHALNVELTVEEPARYHGRKVWVMYFITPYTLKDIDALYQACGLHNPNYENTLEMDTEEVINDLTGSTLVVVIAHKSFDKTDLDEMGRKQTRTVTREDVARVSDDKYAPYGVYMADRYDYMNNDAIQSEDSVPF